MRGPVVVEHDLRTRHAAVVACVGILSVVALQHRALRAGTGVATGGEQAAQIDTQHRSHDEREDAEHADAAHPGDGGGAPALTGGVARDIGIRIEGHG